MILVPVALVTAPTAAIAPPRAEPAPASPTRRAKVHHPAAARGAPARQEGAAVRLLDTKVPRRSSEAVLALSPSMKSTHNTVTLWQRSPGGWREVGPAMAGRDGLHGWSAHRVRGDLKSPIGVFGLSAAGGALPNPGTRLPYEHDPAYFDVSGTFLGHSISGIYDYVVPIDFNREPGTPPSNPIEPDGPAEGGGIWLHVGNGTATAGCVTLSRQSMARILRFLDPRRHPVIVMGPQ